MLIDVLAVFSSGLRPGPPAFGRAALLCAVLCAGCGPERILHVTDGSDARSFVESRDGSTSDPASVRFRAGLCEGIDLRPEMAKLDASHFVSFLEAQRFAVQIERPRADLVYVTMTGAGTATPVRMRVAILPGADAAGRELHEAILQHGSGSWGIHRSNLAVLGPVGSHEDALAFAAKTKLICWGVFTVAGPDDSFAVPGGYREL